MLNRIFLTVLVLLGFLSSQHKVWADEAVIPESRQQIQMSFAPLVKKVSPAVVNIYTKRSVAVGFRNPFMSDPFFRQFFGGDLFGSPMRKYMESALGSGVILDGNGLVVTNAHVIKGAEEVSVVLADGRVFESNIALVDEASDLALLRMQDVEETLPFVTLKSSEAIEVGDLVLAIGNPFGVGQTVTSGIVSAQGRSTLDINDFNFFIQTDAAINPGNSGGPLVALDGRVVGINTAIYSRSGGSMGLGFAIPSEMVASVVAAEKNKTQDGRATVIRPWLGITTQKVTSEIAESLALEAPYGVLVAGLHMSSPLRRAKTITPRRKDVTGPDGLAVGDVILSMNGRKIRDPAEMKFRMATIPVGSTARVEVMRKEERLIYEFKAMAPPDEPPRNEIVLKGQHPLSGAKIGQINPAVVLEMGLETGVEEGVIVYDAPRGSRAARVVRSGDVLLEINGKEIKAVKDVQKALAGFGSGDALSLVVNSRGRTSRIYLR